MIMVMVTLIPIPIVIQVGLLLTFGAQSLQILDRLVRAHQAVPEAEVEREVAARVEMVHLI